MDTILQYISGVEVKTLMVLIGLNWILAVGAAIYNGQFRLSRVADFMLKRVLPYLITWIVVSVAAHSVPEWSNYKVYVFGVMVLALSGHIAASLKDMGLKIPEFIAGKDK